MRPGRSWVVSGDGYLFRHQQQTKMRRSKMTMRSIHDLIGIERSQSGPPACAISAASTSDAVLTADTRVFMTSSCPLSWDMGTAYVATVGRECRRCARDCQPKVRSAPMPLERRSVRTTRTCLGSAGTLELRHRRLRHVLVLLRGATAHAARALDHAVSDDRHGAHARDHVAALGRDDALDDRRAGALGELAAGAAESDRRDGLALRAVEIGRASCRDSG